MNTLLDFGNGIDSDNVILALKSDNRVLLSIFNDTTEIINVVSDIKVDSFYRWFHLAVLCDGQYARIYINGQQSASAQLNTIVPRKVIRNKCFIGISSKDLLDKNDKFNTFLDEISIYNVSLSESEIQSLALQNSK
jgi:hypothetical protein